MLRAALADVPSPPAAAMCVSPADGLDLPAFVDQVAGGHPVPTAGSVDGGRAGAGAGRLARRRGSSCSSSSRAARPRSWPCRRRCDARRQAGDHTAAVAVRRGHPRAQHRAQTPVAHQRRAPGGRHSRDDGVPGDLGRRGRRPVGDRVGTDRGRSVVRSPTPWPCSTATAARQAYPAGVVAWLEQGARDGARRIAEAGLTVAGAGADHGDCRQAGRAARRAREAVRLGYRTTVVAEPVVGEARVAAAAHESRVRRHAGRRRARVRVVGRGDDGDRDRPRPRRPQPGIRGREPALARSPRPTCGAGEPGHRRHRRPDRRGWRAGGFDDAAARPRGRTGASGTRARGERRPTRISTLSARSSAPGRRAPTSATSRCGDGSRCSVTRDELMRAFETRIPHPVSARECLQILKVPREERVGVRRQLRALTGDGSLVLVRGHHYALPGGWMSSSGRLIAHPDGYGFVRPESPAPDETGDIFVPAVHMNDAMHGDRVVARVEPRRRDRRREGRIVRILDRANATARRPVRRRRTATAPGGAPRAPRAGGHADSRRRTGRGAAGDMVVAEITRWPTATRGPVGRVVEVLGQLGRARRRHARGHPQARHPRRARAGRARGSGAAGHRRARGRPRRAHRLPCLAHRHDRRRRRARLRRCHLAGAAAERPAAGSACTSRTSRTT